MRYPHFLKSKSQYLKANDAKLYQISCAGKTSNFSYQTSSILLGKRIRGN